MIVLFPDTDDDFVAQWDGYLARWDDAMWARILRQPFSWLVYTHWWVARRWVVPRDIRRS